MMSSCDVDESKVKGEYRNNPTIYTSTGCDLGGRIRRFNVSRVDFHDEIADADNVESKGTEGSIESVEFELGLQESGLAVDERNRTEAAVITLSKVVRVALGEEKADGNMRSVDR